MHSSKHNLVIDFWFNEIAEKQWWVKDPTFDQQIRDRFSAVHKAAMVGELFSWRTTPKGRLAEVIVLDQFSRNMFRDTPAAFGSDSLALVLAQEAVHCGDDKLLNPGERSFLYMPFMHSESLVVHEQGLALFEGLGNESTLNFETRHKKIIEQFGRYPHRNSILGRDSTAEEIEFLKLPGSGF